MATAKNCLISIPDYGKATVWVETLTHGLSIFNLGGRTESDQSRTRRHFFTTHRSSGGFIIEIIFSSHRAQEKFHNWIEGYSRGAADPSMDTPPARVVIPSRNFDKLGVLESAISYGDEVGKVLYKTTLEFMGGSEPVDLNGEGIAIILSHAITGAGIAQPRLGDDKTDDKFVDYDLVRLQPWAAATGALQMFNKVGAIDPDFQSRGGPQPQ